MAFQEHPRLTPRFVAQALGMSDSLGDPKASKDIDVPFAGISSDSRKTNPGSLFIAINGENFDGNEFVEKALASGARGALCRSGLAQQNELDRKYPHAFIYEQEDPLGGFRQLAQSWRNQFRIPLALVAGSAGKTTTKDLLSSLLAGAWSDVHQTQGSHNGFVGIPLTLLGLSPRHRAAVIEVGIDEPGAMEKHFRLVSPDVSVLTAIGPEHLEKLIDVPTVAREEGLAFEKTIESAHGKIAVNLDDIWIEPWFRVATSARRLGFSLKRSASDDSIKGTISSDGKRMRVEGAGMVSQDFPLPLPGRHNAINLLAAISTARLMGVDAPEMLKGLESFKGAEGRSELKELKGGLHVLCDYYNSQPPSLVAALDALRELSQELAPGAPRWACLADMKELGPEELRYHREMAPKILDIQVEHVLLYGARMKALELELKQRGYRGDLRHFENLSELAQALGQDLRGPATLLIKGSRSMRMEEVWRALSQNRGPEVIPPSSSPFSP